jgi:PQQ-dependent dehydrogenase (s-GDH family)
VTGAVSAAPVTQSQPTQTTQPLPPGQSPEGFMLRPVVQELAWPLEILAGPDGFLWVTERTGKRVTRIDPQSGEQRVALTVWEAHQSGGQDGLLGMVFHPELLQDSGNDYVYLAYTYLPNTAATGGANNTEADDTATDDTANDDTATGDAATDENADADDTAVDETSAITETATNTTTTDNADGNQNLDFTDSDDADTAALAALTQRRVKIRRYTYDAENQILRDPVDLLTDLPGSNDHNSGRLVFSPDNTLFYAIGDQGNNQFNRACLPIRAQELPTAEQVAAGDWSNYPGKILRLNLDGSIPEDNPTINGVQSHIYSYGHRNIQGLALGPDGKLYASEHGPKSDDEVNYIQAGMNYGWPYVAGYQDDQAYVYANWSAAEDCQSLAYSDFEIPEGVPTQQESDWDDPNFVPPIYTFGTVADDYDFQPEVCAPNYYICWPTVAPTGLEVYDGASGAIADWSTSLLVTALKTGTVYRLELSEDGASVVGTAEDLVKTTNRYRDLFIDPATGAFYVITDSGNNTQGSFRIPTNALEHPGAILEFSYTNNE